MPHPRDADAVAALDGRRIFRGHIFLRENHGPVSQTDFKLALVDDVITIIYGDGVPHVVTDPVAVAFFTARLIPSLQSAVP